MPVQWKPLNRENRINGTECQLSRCPIKRLPLYIVSLLRLTVIYTYQYTCCVSKVLLKHSPSLATFSVDDGTTPVYYAAQEGRLNVLEHLVGQLGCSVSSRAKDGMMPLHAASQNGHTRVVKYLVETQGREAILGQTGEFRYCTKHLITVYSR